MSKDFFDMKKTNIMVEFRITGNDFDPEHISQALAIVPSNFWRKGDHVKDKPLLREFSCWAFNTGYEESLDVKAQIEKINKKFECQMDKLGYLKKQYDLSFWIDIVVNIEEGQPPGIHFDKNQLKFFDALDAELDIDLYVYS